MGHGGTVSVVEDDTVFDDTNGLDKVALTTPHHVDHNHKDDVGPTGSRNTSAISSCIACIVGVFQMCLSTSRSPPSA